MAVKDKGLTPMMKQFFTFKHQHPDAIRLLQQKKLQLLKQQLKRLKKQQQNNCLLCKYDIRGKHEILFPSFFLSFCLSFFSLKIIYLGLLLIFFV